MYLLLIVLLSFSRSTSVYFTYSSHFLSFTHCSLVFYSLISCLLLIFLLSFSYSSPPVFYLLFPYVYSLFCCLLFPVILLSFTVLIVLLSFSWQCYKAVWKKIRFFLYIDSKSFRPRLLLLMYTINGNKRKKIKKEFPTGWLSKQTFEWFCRIPFG